jgi:hypothetical protein
MRGQKITSISRIMELARECKAIIVDRGLRDWRTSAAFLQNFQAHRLQVLIDQGKVYEYKSLLAKKA